jgi:hypothetical protein
MDWLKCNYRNLDRPYNVHTDLQKGTHSRTES